MSTEIDALVRRLREPIIENAFANYVLTDGKLAERLIVERLEAANEIERLVESLRLHRNALMDQNHKKEIAALGERAS